MSALFPPPEVITDRFDAVLRQGGPPAPEAIAAAVARADYDTAATLAFAGALAGQAPPAALTASVLPGVEDFGLFLLLLGTFTSADADTLVTLVADGRIPGGRLSQRKEAIALHAAWRLGDRAQLRAGLILPVRKLARRLVDPVAAVLVGRLVRELDDENLHLAAAHLQVEADAGARLVDEFDNLLALPSRAALACIPLAEVQANPVAGFTIRTGPKVGRNDPCPCGSGKKYKRCHQDADAQEYVPSPVAGQSWTDYLERGADAMTIDDVYKLSVRDLGRVALAKLGDTPLIVAMRRFLSIRRLDRAEEAMDLLAARATLEPEDADDFRSELVGDAIRHRDLDLARRQLEKLRDPATADSGDVLAFRVLERAPTALAQILTRADAAVRDGSGGEALGLAYALLDGAPALGILVARGALRADRRFDCEVLLEGIEDARDELNVPPGDPAWDLWAVLAEDDEHDHAAGSPGRHADVPTAEAQRLRGELRDVGARVADLEAQLRDRERELHDSAQRRDVAEPPPAAPARTAPSGDDSPALRAKLAELKGLIREGNHERQELRRQLSASARTVPQGDSSARAPAASGAGPGQASDADDGDALTGRPVRGVLVPRFTRHAEDALGHVPTHVAAEAVRLAGALAAGDSAAWRGVKQAKDMPRPLLMARLGLHHRFLFRAGEGALEAVDVIVRESLDLTLKRLRSG